MQRTRPSRPPPPNSDRLNQSTAEQKLRVVKEYYESSMCYVNNGLSADEENNVSLAIQHYINALQCLEKGIGTDLPYNENARNVRAHEMQQRMIEVLEHVQTRLYNLQSAESAIPNEAAPAYSVSPPEGHTSTPIAVPSEKAVQLLCIPGGVQLFCVSSGSDVSSAPPSYPTSLQIMLFDDDQPNSSNRPPGFIQVGDWIYPLVPGQSPVLRCTSGAYMFPNLAVDHSSPHPNTVGLVISSELDPSYREMFENILMNFAAFQVQQHPLEGEPNIDLSSSVPYIPVDTDKDEEEKKEEGTMSDKIASGIEKGAEWISWGLVKGAQITSTLIHKGATELQARLQPNATPSKINPNVEKGLYYTHQASKVTVKVSAALVTGLCAVTKEIGKAISPHVVSCTKAVLPSSATETDGEGKSAMDGVVTVAGAGLAGLGAVWTSLEQAGLAVAHSVSGATVNTVQYKYGSEAGQATGHAMGAAVNVGRTAFNIDNLGIKAIVKRTAKDTGREVLQDFAKEKSKNDLEDEKEIEPTDKNKA